MKTDGEVSTWGISPQVRKSLARFVLHARHALKDDFRRQLVALGVHPDRTADSGRDLSAEEAVVRQAALAVIDRAIAGGGSREEAFDTFIADSAFTFINRLVGLRCLEERRMLIMDGQAETAIRLDPRLGASSLYFQVRNQLRTDVGPREVWHEALDRAFRAVSERVGLLFDPASEYGRLFPLQATLKGLVDGLNDPAVPSEVWREDEVLGWVYQYYNAEEKDAVYDKLRSGGKIEHPEELAAATCLYTERYMVDFLLQNTLGMLWVDMKKGTALPNRWPYFVPTKEQRSTEKDVDLPLHLRDVTLLDPACGSGHFLARAFDLLVEMYREEALEAPEDIPHLILERNLHGLDIDLRAVQISALRLYLKACQLNGGDFRPRRMNLVSADVVLPTVLPAQLFERFKGDLGVQELMKAMWSELKDAPKLGSLLHPERRVDDLLTQRRRNGPTLEHQDDRAWERYKLELLDGIRVEFEKEAHTGDIARRLFGQELARSMSLIEALGRHYDVVVTNPPYAGSKNLDDLMKSFVWREYGDGKRDLYAAFIQRAVEFVRPCGFVGMVTQQSWLFLRSFAKLRERVLESMVVTTLAQLGPHSFEEIGGEVVNVALFTLQARLPSAQDWITAFRLVGPKSPAEKDSLLRRAIAGSVSGIVSAPKQYDLKTIPESPFVYWLRPHFFELLKGDRRLSDVADVRVGLQTSDNERFLRYSWEVSEIGHVKEDEALSGRWFWYAKGGRYQKWAGLEWLVVDWENDGCGIKEFIVSLGNTHWSRMVRNPERYFQPGLTYTLMASGSMGARLLDESAFDVAGISIFPQVSHRPEFAAVLNTHLVSYILRVTTQDLKFHAGYVGNLPLPKHWPSTAAELGWACIALKRELVQADPCERSFNPTALFRPTSGEKALRDTSAGHMAATGETLFSVALAHLSRAQAVATALHSLEGWNERLTCSAYELDGEDVQAIIEETGTPAGWYPLVSGYDQLPDGPVLPSGFGAYFADLDRRTPSPLELAFMKQIMRDLYTAGPGSRITAPDEATDSEETVLGAHAPIPTETFIEELSQRVGTHPVSVLNMLSELAAEGVLSPPEIRRALEDWISVALLLMLGYRWPEQGRYERQLGSAIDVGLIDADGIIPLMHCDQQATAAQRIITLLEYRFGDERAARSLEEFRSWVGRDVTDWLMRDFFRRHVQQFKQRPVAWHLKSPEGTFQAIVLYHKLSRDVLRRLRDVYAGTLVKRLKGELQRAEQRGDSRTAEELRFRIEDTEEFRDRISAIEEGRELRNRIRCRWKDEERDGRPGPYAPDLDDGVKVNIRPFQETGLLARDVIKKW